MTKTGIQLMTEDGVERFYEMQRHLRWRYAQGERTAWLRKAMSRHGLIALDWASDHPVSGPWQTPSEPLLSVEMIEALRAALSEPTP